MKLIYLSIGSNLGDRAASLQQAVNLLRSRDLEILRLSPVYETSPQENPNQPDFLNAVIEASTLLFPVQLLTRLKSVERQMGRKPAAAKGPRVIDIDILFYGRAIVNMADLQIPHVALSKRRFVLEPLARLAPDLRHPITRETVLVMLRATLSQELKPIPLQLIVPPANKCCGEP